MQKGQVLIFIILAIVAAGFVGVMFYVGGLTPNRSSSVTSTSQPTTTPSATPNVSPTPTGVDLISQECGVCGSKGLHNLDGRQCALGLECKNRSEGVASSVYFCVKPGESIETCLEK